MDKAVITCDTAQYFFCFAVAAKIYNNNFVADGTAPRVRILPYHASDKSFGIAAFFYRNYCVQFIFFVTAVHEKSGYVIKNAEYAEYGKKPEYSFKKFIPEQNKSLPAIL